MSFYCEKCAEENGWGWAGWLFKSYGPCETCGETRMCSEGKVRVITTKEHPTHASPVDPLGRLP